MSKAKLFFEKILNAFAWVVFILAIVVCAVTVFSTFSDEENGKELFGYKFLIVASDSMSKSEISQDEEIFFNAGDIVIIKTGEDTTSLQPGQVISFFSYNPDSFGKTLTHKIREPIYSTNGALIGYVTYGINKGENDQALVPADSIIGVYEGKIPLLGHVFAFLKTPRGFFMSVITPTVLLIIYFSIVVGRILGKRELLAGTAEGQANPFADEVASLKLKIAQLESQEPQQVVVQAEQTPIVQEVEPTPIPQVAEPAPVQQVAQQKAGKRQAAQALLQIIGDQFALYNKVTCKTNANGTTYFYKNKPLVSIRATEQSLAFSFKASSVKMSAIRTDVDAINFVDNLMSQHGATQK